MTQPAPTSKQNDSFGLLPLIRSRVHFEIVKLEGRLHGVHDAGQIPIVFRPFGQELAVALVRDTEEEWVAVTPEDLSELDLSFDAALNSAMNHFTQTITAANDADIFEKVEAGYWVAKPSEDAEACSHILFPQIIKQLGIEGKPIAFIPDGNTLWIADSKKPKIVAQLAEAALKAFDHTKETAITPLPFVLDDKRWLAYHVDERHPAAKMLARARLSQARLNYETQQDVLTKHAGEDAPLATPFVVVRKDSRSKRSHSYSISEWKAGDSVLLPRTEYVTLKRVADVRPKGQGQKSQSTSNSTIVLKWATLSKALGDRMQAQELFPERYLVRQFFSNQEWQQLVPHQVDLNAIATTTASSAKADSIHATKSIPGAYPANAPQKSNATWWVLGCASATVLGLVVFLVVGIIMIYSFRPSSRKTDMVESSGTNRTTRQLEVRPDGRSRRPSFPTIEFPTQRSTSIAPPEPKKLDDSEIDLPMIEVSENTLSGQTIGNAETGTPFTSAAPDGGMLVGFQFGLNASWGTSICGLRPIYQVGREYKTDSWFGSGDLQGDAEAIAKPGYAVSGMKIREGLVINAIQVEFKKVSDDGRLDATDRYVSEWIGRAGGGSVHLDAGQNPIMGIKGTYRDELISFGWVTGFALPEPKEPIARFEPSARNEATTIGEPQYEKYADEAPEGGVLVGMRVFRGDRWGGVIQSLQPIYQVEDRYVLGKQLGPEGGQVEEVFARPGYAIGAIHAKEGLVLNCIQLVFYRYADGKLDPSNDYHSDWIGINSGTESQTDSRESPIVGLQLTAQVDIHSITPISGQP